MSGFDADRVYNVAVHDVPGAVSPDSPAETEKLLLEFLLQYRVGGEFIYRCVFLARTLLCTERDTETNFAQIYY